MEKLGFTMFWIGSVSKVEMTTPMPLICKALFPSVSTFETPPKNEASLWAQTHSQAGIKTPLLRCDPRRARVEDAVPPSFSLESRCDHGRQGCILASQQF